VRLHTSLRPWRHLWTTPWDYLFSAKHLIDLESVLFSSNIPIILKQRLSHKKWDKFCQVLLKNIFFWWAQFGYLYFLSFRLLNEPRFGAGIDPGIALTPFPSSIGWDSNPQLSNHESSLLTTRPDFRSFFSFFGTVEENDKKPFSMRTKSFACLCVCVWVWECVCCECAHFLCTKQARIYYTS